MTFENSSTCARALHEAQARCVVAEPVEIVPAAPGATEAPAEIAEPDEPWSGNWFASEPVPQGGVDSETNYATGLPIDALEIRTAACREPVLPVAIRLQAPGEYPRPSAWTLPHSAGARCCF